MQTRLNGGLLAAILSQTRRKKRQFQRSASVKEESDLQYHCALASTNHGAHPPRNGCRRRGASNKGGACGTRGSGAGDGQWGDASGCAGSDVSGGREAEDAGHEQATGILIGDRLG